ncbi:MAG: hypothetical protein A2Y33_01410 [Spirochaetes bacterium GWF1_51_8]|nr:MAG: hypothetical protein A2Y33_01410 [Spirochaetes bacterium GWF1_51_8]
MKLKRPDYRNDGDLSAKREPVFSPDGSRCAFRYRDNGKWYMNADDQVFGPFDKVQSPKFSSDSHSVGFIYKIGELAYLNLNGTVYGGYRHFSFRFIEEHRVVMVYERDGDIYIDEV